MMITDRRKIDQDLKDYVIDDDSDYETMNAVSQRVYIALSRLRLTETRKKSANLKETEITRIQNALSHLVDKNLISNINIKIDTFTAGMSIVIQYTNLTIQQEESVNLG